MTRLETLSPTYTIGTLSSLTGLSQHTIRAWERRYSALSPNRSETNRRLYVEEDVTRLKLIKKVVESGHSIGQVAQLPVDQLLGLGGGEQPIPTFAAHEFPVVDASRALSEALSAVHRLDPERLEATLARAHASMGILGLLREVVIPLLGEVGAGWVDGTVSIAQEHTATAVLRGYLDVVRKSLQSSPTAPRLMVTTPQNQFHEIGAQMVAIMGAAQGWAVTYLGPNMPALEIAAAARQRSARAVGLSLVFPLNDEALPGELRLLRENLDPSVHILVGGQATTRYADVLSEIGALVSHDLWTLRDHLAQIVAA